MWDHLRMAAEDDPEQRIRDLERSLSDRASELGSSSAEAGTPQYGYVDSPVPTYIPPADPYPPPPAGGYPPPLPTSAPGSYESYGGYGAGGFGAGYPPPRAYSTPPAAFGAPFERRSPGAFRFGWLLLAIPIIGLVIGAISFAVFFSTAADDFTSEFSSMQSEGPSIGFPGPATGSPGGVPTAAAGGTVSVAGVSKRESVTCNGGSVNVSGVKNTVEITGQCASVDVSGVENTVVVESADVINASGFTNRITYRSGSPATSATGDNVIAPA